MAFTMILLPSLLLLLISTQALGEILIEGDIVVDKQLLETMKPKNAYDGVTSTRQHWPGGVVPYAYGYQFDSNRRRVLQEAIAEFNRVTCIKFVPRTTQYAYVNFMVGNGCFSQIGKTGGRQDISIGQGCNYKGIVMHEMMHAIGFYHEQSRLDRDQYVNIYWQNITPVGMKFNFQKYAHGIANYYGEKYDYDSLMHYENTAFGNRRVTIAAKGNPNKVLGQRRGFSPIDIKQMNKMYKCSGGVTGTVRPPVVTQAPPSGCYDMNTQCNYWRQIGECTKNPVYMKLNCKKSCGYCGTTSGCKDISPNCRTYANSNTCRTNNYTRQNCKKSCKVC